MHVAIARLVNHRPVYTRIEDGECPVCDYPYGGMAHVCIGAAARRPVS
jgi:hypothetical protein